VLNPDVSEKVFEMEDVDPDDFQTKAKILEAEQGKVFEKNADGTFKVPKFELNLILKVKRKHLIFEGVKFKDLDTAGAEEIENDIDYFLPQFMLRKGIRVFWDKATAQLESACYDAETKGFLDDEHIVKNFKLTSKSNLKRINNEFIIDFRNKLIKDTYMKAAKKFEE